VTPWHFRNSNEAFPEFPRGSYVSHVGAFSVIVYHNGEYWMTKMTFGGGTTYETSIGLGTVDEAKRQGVELLRQWLKNLCSYAPHALEMMPPKEKQ
jgi:hypothetical protein